MQEYLKIGTLREAKMKTNVIVAKGSEVELGVEVALVDVRKRQEVVRLSTWKRGRQEMQLRKSPSPNCH